LELYQEFPLFLGIPFDLAVAHDFRNEVGMSSVHEEASIL
jgi:hypothetical protein